MTLILAWLGRDFEQDPLSPEELERAGYPPSGMPWIPTNEELDKNLKDDKDLLK